MLSDKNREYIIVGLFTVIGLALFFSFLGFITYQAKQTENKQIEYCREMKIQPKDCK